MQKNVVKFGAGVFFALSLFIVFKKEIALSLLVGVIGCYTIYKIIRKSYDFSVIKSAIVAFMFFFVLFVILFFIWRWWALLYLFAGFAENPVPISKISFNEWRAIILWLINPTH